MRSNAKVKKSPVYTHEGGKAVNISLERQLERSVMSCLLFEDTFYEDGEDIFNRILNLSNKVSANKVADLAVRARTEGNLRHVPLLLCVALAKRHYDKLADVLYEVIQRPDEIPEFLALWFND